MMSSSRTRASANKKLNPLEKRIPENPRYAHIKHTVDSGASVTKYLRHLEEIKQNYRYRKDEIFRRLKATTFAQLVLQVEMYQSEDILADDEDGENENGWNMSQDNYARMHPVDRREACGGLVLPEGNDPSPPDTARSTLSSVISGVGEMDLRKSPTGVMTAQKIAPPVPPYLLLDVRDRDSYDRAHIITAKNYPATMLSRSCNYFTRDILEYKNKPGKIIILYDEDERVTPPVATTFIQREVDNIFMLSGGMKVLSKTFPGCMITGSLPPSCLLSPPNSSRSSGGKRLNGPGASSKGRDKGKPLLPATSTLTAGGEIEHREKFTEEDLDRIQTYLDDALLSVSATSSRSSTAASHCTTTSRSTLGTPWK